MNPTSLKEDEIKGLTDGTSINVWWSGHSSGINYFKITIQGEAYAAYKHPGRDELVPVKDGVLTGEFSWATCVTLSL